MIAIIEEKRRQEVVQLIKVRIILYGFVVPLMYFTPILINIVTFVIYYKTSGKRLTASVAYPTLAFTAILQSALMQVRARARARARPSLPPSLPPPRPCAAPAGRRVAPASHRTHSHPPSPLTLRSSLSRCPCSRKR